MLRWLHNAFMHLPIVKERRTYLRDQVTKKLYTTLGGKKHGL